LEWEGMRSGKKMLLFSGDACFHDDKKSSFLKLRVLYWMR
jgi:hypothetical protein